MTVKISWFSCKSWVVLRDNTKATLSYLDMEADIVKATDFIEITKYGIMSTPGLVVD